jgi:hypothetical protein
MCDTYIDGLLPIYTDMQPQFNFVNRNFVFLRQHLWPSKCETILQLRSCILVKYRVTYHLLPLLKQKPLLHMQGSLLFFLSYQSRYYYHVNPMSIFQWTSPPPLPSLHTTSGGILALMKGESIGLDSCIRGIFHYLILSTVSSLFPVDRSDLLVVPVSYWKWTGFIRYQMLRYLRLYNKTRGPNKMYHSKVQNYIKCLLKNK